MPNWVTNTLSIEGENAEQIMNEITDEQGKLDFNLVLPMPEDLRVVSSPVKDTVKNEKEYQRVLKEYYEEEKLFGDEWVIEKDGKKIHRKYSCGIPITKERCKRYQKEYGALSWYDWANTNWGTKWNADSHEADSVFVEFSTAWSMPQGYYLALSKKYPDHIFHTTWYDEDWGSNLGEATFEAGQATYDIPDTDKEAFELLFRLNPNAEENYELVDGEYKYKEEE